MFQNLPAQVRGCISLSGYFLNTLLWVPLVVLMAFIRALIPIKAWHRWCGRMANSMAENWISVNNINQKLTGNTRLEVTGLEGLDPSQWYLVLANHQSWVDILVLQRIFNRRIPFLKFFLKKELFWFPIMGQAWWALDFPFIKRYRKSLLKKKPHLKGKDIEITRQACQKFKTLPVSVMNFVEGTRFTEDKHRRQRSPYANLLKTKAGGIAFVLGAMGDQIHRVLDVTIVYSHDNISFWSFLCNNIETIKVQVNSLPVDDKILGDYAKDRAFRKNFHSWLNGIWEEKDRRMNNMMKS